MIFSRDCQSFISRLTLLCMEEEGEALGEDKSERRRALERKLGKWAGDAG